MREFKIEAVHWQPGPTSRVGVWTESLAVMANWLFPRALPRDIIIHWRELAPGSRHVLVRVAPLGLGAWGRPAPLGPGPGALDSELSLSAMRHGAGDGESI
jgi:hypothetical protein